MKNYLKIPSLLFSACLFFLLSCSSENKADKREHKSKQSVNPNEMTATMEAKYTGSVGYGNIFDCEVIESNYPDGDLSNLYLIILAGSQFSEALPSNDSPKKLTVHFRKTDRKSDGKLVPEDGFVGNDSLVWEIVSIDQN